MYQKFDICKLFCGHVFRCLVMEEIYVCFHEHLLNSKNRFA